MPWIPFAIISGIASLVLVVLVVALVRHIRLLAGSLAQFRRETEPVLGQLRRDAEVMRERLEAASRAAAELRPDERAPRR